MSWIEVISGAFHLMAAQIKPILWVLLVVFLPISILDGVLVVRLNGIAAAVDAVGEIASAADAEMLRQALMQVGVTTLIALAIALFLAPVGTIALAKLVKQALLGEPLTVKEAVLESMQLIPAIVLVGLMYGIFIFLTSIVIFPGIYLAVAWNFYPMAIGLAGARGWDALSHSRSLVKGRWWRTFGVFFVIGLIGMLWNTVFESVCAVLGTGFLNTVVYQLFAYFSSSFATVAMTLIYLNRMALQENTRADFEARDFHLIGDAAERTDETDRDKTE